ncbi:ferrochelatase [Saccharospirillum sp. MSK14-1]|uniref:Wadjet anti-phage system protein JetA family protein n=1 Tax=Saccharospirillum sp. MSK14-1 TaxID=1897632 RepID=UPI000D341759|nr:Wadjet anti-phage system protein JetA family protein [Saccharospirillum sp. MSK14-1]PTY36928.1 ferrochelatase [Saccharospirillum sp. MSK14-1]
MFFEKDRSQFFRPLTGKYREQFVECLKELYHRLYTSSSADYGHALSREDLVDTFQGALARAPELASDDGEAEGRFRSDRDQAVWVLNALIEHGWIDKQVDEATLHSSFTFSRYGRQFTEPFVAGDLSSVRSHHRNTRNVRNSLQAFLERGEVYDLLDAWENSERIIADFTDIIAELDDRKRDLVREMGDQVLVQRATQDFFDYMEKRFQPDLAIRLSADNVEKYRDEIAECVRRIRHQKRDFKARAEKRLRELLPEQVREGQSLLWALLDHIEGRLKSASDIMLPALRRALASFTKRADIVIRQISYLAGQQHNDVVQVCQQLVEQDDDSVAAALERASDLMSVPNIGFVDPGGVRLHAPRTRRSFETTVLEDSSDDFDVDARRDLYVQQLLDQAFLINDNRVRQYLARRLSDGDTVTTAELPVETADDLLALAHAIEVGANQSLASDYQFTVEWKNADQPGEYFESSDNFTIRLVNKNAHQPEETPDV